MGLTALWFQTAECMAQGWGALAPAMMVRCLHEPEGSLRSQVCQACCPCCMLSNQAHACTRCALVHVDCVPGKTFGTAAHPYSACFCSKEDNDFNCRVGHGIAAEQL